jgi:hypothetical protein
MVEALSEGELRMYLVDALAKADRLKEQLPLYPSVESQAEALLPLLYQGVVALSKAQDFNPEQWEEALQAIKDALGQISPSSQ